jgi:hypothetical protein
MRAVMAALAAGSGIHPTARVTGLSAAKVCEIKRQMVGGSVQADATAA